MSLTRTSVISTAGLLATDAAGCQAASFARQTQCRTHWPASVVRYAAHDAHDGKAQNTTCHSRSSRAPGNPVGRTPAPTASPRATNSRRPAATGSTAAGPPRSSLLVRSASNNGPTGRGCRGGPAHAVHGRGGQALGRTDHDEAAARRSPSNGVTHSPRPRQIAGPPARKNGTSLPSSAAQRANSSRGRPSRQPSLAATSAAAASLDPPPSPAAAGIRLTSSNSAPRRTPARRRTNSTARTTRLSGPSGTSIEAAAARAAGLDHPSATEPHLSRRTSSRKCNVSYRSIGHMSVSIS